MPAKIKNSLKAKKKKMKV